MRNRVWSILASAAVVGLMAGCHSEPHSERGEVVHLEPAEVDFVVAEEKERPVTEDVVGTVRSQTRADVEAKVAGRIEKMNVDLGDRVEQGEVLAVIDAQEVKARFDRAIAERDQAAREWKRTAQLLQRQVASQREYDSAEARYRSAEAQVRETETMMSYINVTAPFAGVVARRLADPGDFASPGRPLLSLESPESLRFEADVPEALIDSVKSGSEVEVRIPSLGRSVYGVVAEIAPTADPNSRTFPVRINLPKVSGLKTGKFGRAAIPVGEQATIRVPEEAVVLRGQMEMVFVRDGERVSLRLVRTGKSLDGEREILSGLLPGEEVAVKGASRLVDGQPIAARP